LQHAEKPRDASRYIEIIYAQNSHKKLLLTHCSRSTCCLYCTVCTVLIFCLDLKWPIGGDSRTAGAAPAAP